MHLKKAAILVTTALASCLWPMVASGQNLLVNPSFESGLYGWANELWLSSSNGNTWSTADAGASNRSGSGMIETREQIQNAAFARYVQCVPVTAGLKYSVGTRVMVPSDQSGDGYVAIDFQTWSNPDCSGSATLIAGRTLDKPAKGAWIDLESGPFTAPQGSTSAKIMLTASRKQGSKFAAYFDDAWAVAGNGCRANDRYLCLSGNRFEIELLATDPRSSKMGQGVVSKQKGVFGYMSIPGLTGDAGNPEVFVKVLDGRSVNEHFWVFYSGLTDVAFSLKVRDLATNSERVYEKPGFELTSVADTTAF